MEGKSLVFTNGLHADNDPRYQPEGTYRDAENIKLVSRDGNTYTIENVEGTRFSLELPCASNVMVLQLNTDGSADNLVDGRMYRWNLHCTDFDANGVQGSSVAKTMPTALTGSLSNLSGVYYYPYDTSVGLCEMFVTELNAMETSGGQKMFTATHNGKEVIIKPNEINDGSGAGTNQYVATTSFGAVPGSSGGTLTNGYSYNSGTLASATDTDLTGGSYDESDEVPVYFYSRFGNYTYTTPPMCDLTIVGHYSYLNTLYLFTYDYNWSPGTGFFYHATSNGQIWEVTFDNAGRVISTDLKYNNALDFNKSRKLIVEGIIENDCITRLYWTDNKNPIRSLNLTDPNAFAFTLNDLKMSPETSMDRPVLKRIGPGGTLEVGMYQVAYKLKTKGGATGSLSPFTQLISVTKGNINNSNDVNNGGVGGNAKSGEITDKSFDIEVQYVDTDLQEIQFFILMYETFNAGPTKIMKSDSFVISGNTHVYTHTRNDLIEVPLEEVLVEGNTFDTAKDISVKDNRLFAANLSISAKDLSSFDTEVYRWKAEDVKPTTDVSGWSNVNFTSGGTGPNGIKTRSSSITSDYKYLPYGVKDRNNNDQILLGAQTKYFDSTNGGVRITFQTESRVVDKERQYTHYESGTHVADSVINPFGTYGIHAGIQKRFKDSPSSNIDNNQLVQRFSGITQGNDKIDKHVENINTFYQNINYDTNENPYISYDSRGYQRGETYRFAITFYDKNHKQIQTRYVGDIKMPEHYDEQWKFVTDRPNSSTRDITTRMWKDWNTVGESSLVGNTSNVGYNIYDNDSSNRIITKNIYCEDFRLSYVKGNRNPYNDYENHTSTASSMDEDTFGFWKPAKAANSTQINEVPLQNNSNYRYPDDMGGLTNGDRTFGSPDFNHYVQDLHLRFEVIIPKSLKDDIGGYKIVRVKRKEEDKTILGQGILTQTVWAEDSPYESIGAGFDQSLLKNKEKTDYGDKNRDKFAVNIHKKYIPFCNPFHTQASAMCPQVRNEKTSVTTYPTTAPTLGQYQASYNYQPNVGDGPKAGSRGVMQGQLNICNSQKAVGYNRYWTIDSPDFTHMSRGFVGGSGMQLDIISVLKQVDHLRKRAHLQKGWTGIGGAWDSYGSQPGQNVGIMHGRRFLHDIEYDRFGGPTAGFRAIDDSAPEYIYTKFETYDTKSFTWPKSLLSLTHASSNQATSSHSGVSDYFWQKTTNINSSAIADYGQIIFPNGIEFSNNNTDYMLWCETLDNRSNIGFTSGVMRHRGTWFASGLGNRHLSNRWRKSSVGSCAKTVFIELEELNTDDNALVVPDIDAYYIRNDDRPLVGPTGALTNINGAVAANGDLTQIDDNMGYYRIPYSLLANIKKEVVNQYGGKTEDAIENNLFIEVGHYTSINDNTLNSGLQTSKITGGDTFVQFYSKEKYNGGQINKEALDESLEEFEQEGGNIVNWYYPVETQVNTDLLHGTKKSREEVFQNFGVTTHLEFYNKYLIIGSENLDYNEVYSQESDAKSHLVTSDDDCVVTQFPNMVAYSNVKSIGETEYDAWKKFDLADFHDVDGVHGPINNLFVLNDYMYFFQSSAVGLLEVNPKTIIPSTDGSQLYTGSGDTIENHRYITTKYGSQHQHSLILSDTNSYFVDAINEKIFSFNGKSIESITDTKGMSKYIKDILNEGSTNLNLTQGPNVGNVGISQIKNTDTPLLFLGIHGGYNKETGDVVFTFHDKTSGDNISTSYNEGTLVYNDRISAFVTKYSVTPNYWISHMHRLFSTENRLFTQTTQNSDTQNMLYEWMGAKNTNLPLRTQFYLQNNVGVGALSGHVHGFYFEAVINENPQIAKIFDNMGVVMTMQNWQNVNTTNNDVSKFGNEMVGLSFALGYSTTFDKITMTTELSDYSNIGTHQIFNSVSPTSMDDRVIYREGVLHFPTRAAFSSDEGTASTLGRLRGTYMKIKFESSDTTNKFNIFALRPKFRKSHK